jgi:hypothetical protein
LLDEPWTGVWRPAPFHRRVIWLVLFDRAGEARIALELSNHGWIVGPASLASAEVGEALRLTTGRSKSARPTWPPTFFDRMIGRSRLGSGIRLLVRLFVASSGNQS